MEKNDMLEMVVCEMTRRGCSMLEIIKATGYGEGKIREIQKKAGMKSNYVRTEVTQEIREAVIRLFNTTDMSYRKIAIETGIAVSTVGYIIREYKAEKQSKGEDTPLPLMEEAEPSAMDMLESALEMALQAVRKMKEG